MTEVTFNRGNISASFDRQGAPFPYIAAVAVQIGDWVYLDDNNKLGLAIATSPAKARVLGMVAANPWGGAYGEVSIPAGQGAIVAVFGIVMGFTDSTPSFADGNPLYLSKTVPGGMSTVSAGAGAENIQLARMIGADMIDINIGASSAVSS